METGTNDNVETNAEQAKDEEAAPYVSDLSMFLLYPYF